MEMYQNRREAGQTLAPLLSQYANRDDVLVFALPRGGVPVAFEVAQALHAPLDVLIVRKLGVPGHNELAMGAIAAGGVTVFNEEIVESLSIPKQEIDAVIEQEWQELKRRELVYRGHHPFPNIKDKIIILVDDGIATGASMRAAIRAIRKNHPAKVVVAVPVGDPSLCLMMEQWVDEMICPLQPRHFSAVGAWYEDFGQTEDVEVHQLLDESRKRIKGT